MPTEEEFLAGADTTPAALDPPAAVPAESPQTEAQAPAEGEPTEEGEAPVDGDADKSGDGDKQSKTLPAGAQARINELTRLRYEEQRKGDQARRERDQFQAEITRLRQAAQQTGLPPEDQRGAQQQALGLTQADVDRLANERATQIAAEHRFAEDCNRVYQQGIKDHPDFNDALGNFKLLGGITPDLIEAAMETGKPAQVLYELGKDLDEAARILQLSPTRRAVAVAKLANKPAPAPPPVSRAPAPIKPIGSGPSKVETDPDKMSTAEWMKWHDEREAKKRA